MNQANYDFLFKYIVVGDASVGKSCIILRYTQGTFKSEHEPTLGVQFASKIIKVDQMDIKTQIWDTVLTKLYQAGQESFKAITRSYYKGSIGVFLIFDITNKASFESLHKWLYQIKNHSHDRVEIVLLGNKSDLASKRQVTFAQAETFARNNGFKYWQVSALTGERVMEIFNVVTRTIMKRVDSRQINTDGQTSLGVRKGRKQKKEIITRVSSGFNDAIAPQRKSCCK